MKKIKSILVDPLYFALGSFIYSFAITCVMAPARVSPGGITGVATVINYLLDLPVGATALVLNIPLFVLGFLKFGAGFVARTAAATTIASLFLDLTAALVPKLSLNGILAAIFGGMLLGLGLGTVLLRGATTGGTDIAAKLINARFPHISVGRCVLISDVLVVALTALVYGNIESALYSVVALYASSRVMDGLLYGADSGKLIFAVSEKAQEISKGIMSELGRGVTVLPARGAYTGRESCMLVCAVRRHEVGALHRIIRSTDEGAFIIVCEAGEILGEGFIK